MDKNIKVALISLLGTLIGSFAGIVISSSLTNYRIEQLEIKVDKHNQMVERIYVLESKIYTLEKDLEKHH